jgi:WhiB family redox-sensing transcriptional regulator
MNLIIETRPGCTAQAHDTGHAYRKHGCRCPEARQAETARKRNQPKSRARSAEGIAYKAFKSCHRVGTYTTAGVPAFFWDPRRNCADVDPDVMFPERGGGEAVEKAIQVCSGCPFKTRCHEWAVETAQVSGVWGGVNQHQRSREIYARRRSRPSGSAKHPGSSLVSTSSMPTGVAS